MLFELAIADAYSQQWNNSSIDFIPAHNDLSSYSNDTDDEITLGYYTGITQINIAIAKVLTLGHPWVKDFLANSFVVMFKRDPRLGYPGNLDILLNKVGNGNELIDTIDPYSTKGNCTVRAVPIGVLSTPQQVIKATIIQTAITNNNPDDINASIAIALISHYFIYRLGKKDRLKEFLDTYIDTEWFEWETNHITHPNLIATEMAIEAIIRHDSLSELLKDCIEITNINNVNHLAAIAVAAASVSEEYQKDLPESLVDNLENTKYGKNYLLSLDEKLMALIY